MAQLAHLATCLPGHQGRQTTYNRGQGSPHQKFIRQEQVVVLCFKWASGQCNEISCFVREGGSNNSTHGQVAPLVFQGLDTSAVWNLCTLQLSVPAGLTLGTAFQTQAVCSSVSVGCRSLQRRISNSVLKLADATLLELALARRGLASLNGFVQLATTEDTKAATPDTSDEGAGDKDKPSDGKGSSDGQKVVSASITAESITEGIATLSVY